MAFASAHRAGYSGGGPSGSCFLFRRQEVRDGSSQPREDRLRIGKRVWRGYSEKLVWRSYLVALPMLAIFPLGVKTYQHYAPSPSDRIHNPKTAPTSMYDEGAGEKSPLFPFLGKHNHWKPHSVELFHDL